MVVGGGEGDGGLLGGQGVVGIEREADVRADLPHLVRVEREADGEPFVDEHVAEAGRKMSKEINTASSCLDMWGLLPEDVGVALKRASRR